MSRNKNDLEFETFNIQNKAQNATLAKETSMITDRSNLSFATDRKFIDKSHLTLNENKADILDLNEIEEWIDQ